MVERMIGAAVAVMMLLCGASAATAARFPAAPVADAALGTIAGREDLSLVTQAEQAAAASRNSVGNNVRTGEISMDHQAFQNMSGLSVVTANTGNNVAINAAMNVNVAINPR